MSERRLISCLDLAEVEDFTAHHIAEARPGTRVIGRKPTPALIYDVKHLERYRPPSYPELVRNVAAIHRRAEMFGRSILALDGTGVGRPVVEMFLEEMGSWCEIFPVIITPAGKVHADRGFIYVPKQDLAMTVQVVLQQDRLRIAKALKEAEQARRELTAFKYKHAKKSAAVSFEAWREKDHDDIVLSIAIGLWLAEKLRVYEPHVYNPGSVIAGWRKVG